MTKILYASVALSLLMSSQAFAEEKAFPATLTAQAILPANTIIAAPADAPDFLKTAGKFTTPDRKRATVLGSVPGMDGLVKTDLALPFDGQAVQGFSGIKTMPDGTFWSLSDNGFGSKANSSDAALMYHHLKFDWHSGKVEVLKTVFLSDPDKKAPFPIVLEGAEKRYLTGADFDVESIQPVADGFWTGEEFGPYMLHFDTEGRLTNVIATVVNGKPVKSPTIRRSRCRPTPHSSCQPSISLARVALKGLRSRRTAQSFMLCWKARSIRTTGLWRRSTVSRHCGSSNSTLLRKTGPDVPGSIRSRPAANRSAISTCSMPAPGW